MAEASPSPGPGPQPRSGGFRAGPQAKRPFAAGALVALGAIIFYNVLVPGTPPLTQRDVDGRVAEALASVTPPPAFSEVVYRAVRPSLVLVESKRPNADDPEDDDDGVGSGVIINDDGDILTSLHVVAEATEIELTFADGSRSTATVVASQAENDIAVIRADDPPADLVPAILGNPAAVREGSEAYALGSPFGLGGSLSAGVISGVDRTFRLQRSGQVLRGLFQIDAAVNPGSSGGPLLDREGHVIGIVTALLNPTDEDFFIGIGLAVPIDVAAGAAGLPPY